jgi:cobyrinic acid a,c-diamide synthase
MTHAFTAPRLLVAGTSSGVGKTTFTAGLCYALRRRGLRVAAFKCGPDYLDPTYLTLASGRVCQSVDGYMMGQGGVLRTFARAAADADISVLEGMMGLFDGSSATSIAGSSAEIARWLDAPVVLMCDASAMARSLGALVQGFVSFEPGVNIGGVVCNGVASKGHRALLEAASPRPILGTLARETAHTFPERHLGLRNARELGDGDAWLVAWADRIEAQCDVDALIALARSAPPAPSSSEAVAHKPRACRIGVARDEAFCFYYDENLRLLEAAGAELAFFSPIHDAALPDVDGVYLGGGYPELHAAVLSNNQPMREALHAHAARRRPIYAECGGLMYLSEAIVTIDGERHPMLGLVSGTAEVQRTLQAIGYVEIETRAPSLLGPSGTRARGHQFRYSRLEGGGSSELYALRTPSSAEMIVGHEGYGRGSVLGSYVHLCFASAPAIAESFVRACVQSSN